MSHHQKFSSASISPQPSPPPSATRSRNRLPLSSLHHLPESSTECFPTATTTTTSDSRRNRTQPQRRNNKKSSVVATATAATHSKKASAECTDSQLDKLRRALPPVPAQSVLRRRVSKWAASGTAKFVVGYKVIPLPLSAKEEEGFCLVSRSAFSTATTHWTTSFFFLCKSSPTRMEQRRTSTRFSSAPSGRALLLLLLLLLLHRPQLAQPLK